MSIKAAVTDEMVDAAARVIWDDRDARHGGPWEGRATNEVCVVQTRATARAALDAALRVMLGAGMIKTITHPPERATKITELVKLLIRYRMSDTTGVLSDQHLDDMIKQGDIAFMLMLLREAAPLYPLPEFEL
jgi:hypothetical protein